MSNAQITIRNRVSAGAGHYDLAHPNDVSGSVTFHLAPDAPFEGKRVNYGVSESVANSLSRMTDALGVAEELKGCRLSGWPGGPSIGQLIDYLNSVADRDYYLECCERLPKLEKEIESLELRRDTMQDFKRRYEAERVAEQVQATITAAVEAPSHD